METLRILNSTRFNTASNLLILCHNSIDRCLGIEKDILIKSITLANNKFIDVSWQNREFVDIYLAKFQKTADILRNGKRLSFDGIN